MAYETPKYRNLSGIYYFLNGAKPRQAVCFEELPQEQRDEIVDKYDVEALIRLATMLDETFRECIKIVADSHGFEKIRQPSPLPHEQILRADPWLLRQFINFSAESLVDIGNAFDLSNKPNEK